MSDSNDMLEVLQADVAAILAATPALADAVVLADNEGDIEAKVTRALGTLTGTKKGLCVVVLLPEITESETNLPGPPVLVEVEIQTIEAVTINRATGGTGLRSSQAALITLNALHHQVLGSRALYADKDPITPVKVKPGFVSHAVKLLTRASGLQGPGKASAVEAAVVAGTGMVVAGAGTVASNGTYAAADGMYSKAGWYIRPAPDNSGRWWFTLGGVPYYISNDTTAATPAACSGWYATGNGTLPLPTVTATPHTLALTCATSGAAIYYTTDGSYPAEANTHATLYTAPIALPAAGTMVRAAAYKTALNPGDCAEIIITA